MSKKDFTQANTGRVYNQIAEATAEPAENISHNEYVENNNSADDNERQTEGKPKKARKEYHGEEAQKWQKKRKTQGRKGCKMVRINMAFDLELHDFIRTMARVRGESMTEFTNYVFKLYMEDHLEVYKKAMEFKNTL
ncbi:MAG: hypothetical protein K5894_09955 [Lachnospiraceae bacterium]|nr:hypothetical protein [Lachnospiraceae bacterium]